jgi:hypothetical protein
MMVESNMFLKLLIGSAMIVLNLGIQVWSVTMVINFFKKRYDANTKPFQSGKETRLLSIILSFLFLGHILQFTTWALLFMAIGEFQDFETAFYHSTVNFTSLGYGDIVMTEPWRLLGALEAANGVLMFGLTAGLVLTVMNSMFNQRIIGKR